MKGGAERRERTDDILAEMCDILYEPVAGSSDSNYVRTAEPGATI